MTTDVAAPRVIRTYRTRVYLSKAGHDQLDEVLARQALLYNAGLEERKTAWQYGRNQISYFQQSRELTEVRKDFPDIEGALDRRIQIGTLKRLDRAFQAFFRRARAGETPGYPRFKSSRRWRTLELYSGASRYVRMDKAGRGHVRIKGLPRLKFKDLRIPLDRQPLEMRVSRRSNGVYLYMVFDIGEAPAVLDLVDNPVGIDAGVIRRFTLSDGTVIERRSMSPWVKRRIQRKLARQKKGSYSRRKTLMRLRKFEERQTIRNRQELHRLTAELVKRYDFFAIEDLDIQRMTRSARGTVENPGEDVGVKRDLNREILSQTWGEFAQSLAYKAEGAGKRLVRVPPEYTTLTCSICGTVKPASARSGISIVYSCSACGSSMSRQVNSARNILARGQLAASSSGEAVIEGRAEMKELTAGVPAVRPESHASDIAQHDRASPA